MSCTNDDSDNNRVLSLTHLTDFKYSYFWDIVCKVVLLLLLSTNCFKLLCGLFQFFRVFIYLFAYLFTEEKTLIKHVTCRSQWPRGLRHELSSLARTLGLWVRIPLKRMDVCVRLFCLCCPVCRYRPCDELIPPSKESYRLCKNDYETEEEARAQQRAVQPLMNKWINEKHVT
jgi:hypothetical protein